MKSVTIQINDRFEFEGQPAPAQRPDNTGVGAMARHQFEFLRQPLQIEISDRTVTVSFSEETPKAQEEAQRLAERAAKRASEGDYGKAISLWKRVLELNPILHKARRDLAMATLEAGDRTDTVSNNVEVFFMSNIIPQTSQNNQGVWAQFEGYCRSLTNGNSEILITCGPSGFNGTRIPSGHAAIPSNVWKIVVVVPTGGGTALSRLIVSNRVISIRIPNTSTVSTPWQHCITTARAIELETGFNFFNAVPGPIASACPATGVADPPRSVGADGR